MRPFLGQCAFSLSTVLLAGAVAPSLAQAAEIVPSSIVSAPGVSPSEPAAPATVMEPKNDNYGILSPPPAVYISPVPPNGQFLLENGLSLNGVAINNRSDVGNTVSTVTNSTDSVRQRGAVSASWTPRLAWRFRSGFVFGVQGNIGVLGASSSAREQLVETTGATADTKLKNNTGIAFQGGGGAYFGLRHYTAGNKYLQMTLGASYQAHRFAQEGLKSKNIDQRITVDARYDVGFPVRKKMYLAIGPTISMAVHRFSGSTQTTKGIEMLSAGLNLSLTHAFL